MSEFNNYLFIGASRNIGLHAVTSVLTTNSSATCTLLLRNPDSFKSANPSFEEYLSTDRLRVVKGDATSPEAVATAWNEAEKGKGKIDAVLYSVGATPTSFSLTQGAVIIPSDVCASTITVLLQHMHSLHLRSPQTPLPRLISISSSGLTKSEHSRLPFWERPLYGWMLQQPHADKLALEYLIFQSAAKTWPEGEPIPKGATEMALSSIAPGGWLKDFVIVRPALLIDSSKDDSAYPYKASDEFKSIPGTISRTAVARFIVNECLQKDCQWSGRTPVIGW